MYESNTATDYLDLMERLNTFLTATGSAFGLAYTGTGNGTITGLKGGASSIAETFTITATSSTTFTVVGSVSGALANATVGTPYSTSKLQFTITAGGTAFVATDAFTVSTAPKWTAQRSNRAKAILGSFNEPFIPFNYHRTIGGSDYATAIAFPATLGCQLASAQSVYAVVITPDGSAYNTTPATFDLQYSDNGSTWNTQQSYTASSWTSNAPQTFTVTSPSSHAYWRIQVNTVSNSGTQCNIQRIEFRGQSGVISHFDCIWKAPGNDGAQSIYVGVMPFAHVSADYYNWRIGGFTGFTDYTSFANQAGPCVDPVLPLWQSSIPYWFIADGSRVKIVAKVSSQYECAYMGYIDAYGSPGQYPYPLAIGATAAWYYDPSLNSSSWRWSYIGGERHAPWRGAQNSSSGDKYCNFRLRNQAGVWKGYTAINATDPQSIWPNFTVMTDLRPNLDGSLPLFPYILNDTAPNCWGEISGVSAVSGYSNGSENTVTINGVSWLVVQDVTRTTSQSYAALKLD